MDNEHAWVVAAFAHGIFGEDESLLGGRVGAKVLHNGVDAVVGGHPEAEDSDCGLLVEYCCV